MIYKKYMPSKIANLRTAFVDKIQQTIINAMNKVLRLIFLSSLQSVDLIFSAWMSFYSFTAPFYIVSRAVDRMEASCRKCSPVDVVSAKFGEIGEQGLYIWWI